MKRRLRRQRLKREWLVEEKKKEQHVRAQELQYLAPRQFIFSNYIKQDLRFIIRWGGALQYWLEEAIANLGSDKTRADITRDTQRLVNNSLVNGCKIMESKIMEKIYHEKGISAFNPCDFNPCDFNPDQAVKALNEVILLCLQRCVTYRSASTRQQHKHISVCGTIMNCALGVFVSRPYIYKATPGIADSRLDVEVSRAVKKLLQYASHALKKTSNNTVHESIST